MDIKLFNKLWELRPSQYKPEFRTFLEVCEMYLKKHKIKNPIVVELGVYNNSQKKFYEQLLNAEYIGIDCSTKRSTPDILGNTHDFETLNILRKKLNGRFINILFIDASHHYEDVKKDFEIYMPLCSDIVALHDINTYRYKERRHVKVYKFWDELTEDICRGRKYKDFLYFSIAQYRAKVTMGIGMIIKR